MHAVESSVVAQLGYDNERQVLRVVFHRGGVYDFYMIPRSVFSLTSPGLTGLESDRVRVRGVMRVGFGIPHRRCRPHHIPHGRVGHGLRASTPPPRPP